MKKIDDNQKNNVPDENFEVSWEVYEKNKWYIKETWKNLQEAKVENIEIQLEESFIKPRGSIAWIILLTGNKSCIPVNMNQPYEAFKEAFKKTGNQIFSKIKFLENYPKKDKKESFNVYDLYEKMRAKVT
jgi:hypothetical protein